MKSLSRIAAHFYFASILFFALLGDADSSQNTLETFSAQEFLSQAQTLYRNQQKAVEAKMQEVFQVDVSKDIQQYQKKREAYLYKLSLIQKEPDWVEKAKWMAHLAEEYPEEGMRQSMKAYYYFQNEMENDHAFVGRYLELLERVLEQVIQEDAFFSYVFSREFESRYGMILKRVVWRIQDGEDVAGQTLPLEIRSVFGNASKTPLLIKLTPAAFKSLPFLRSMLVHEINHAYMFKMPEFLNVQKFSGPALKPAAGKLSHYFKQLVGTDPHYQYYLVHEYYSVQAQLYLEKCQVPGAMLDPADFDFFKKFQGWILDQMNDANRRYVETHPEPPVQPDLEQFYGCQTTG